MINNGCKLTYHDLLAIAKRGITDWKPLSKFRNICNVYYRDFISKESTYLNKLKDKDKAVNKYKAITSASKEKSKSVTGKKFTYRDMMYMCRKNAPDAKTTEKQKNSDNSTFEKKVESDLRPADQQVVSDLKPLNEPTSSIKSGKTGSDQNTSQGFQLNADEATRPAGSEHPTITPLNAIEKVYSRYLT